MNPQINKAVDELIDLVKAGQPVCHAKTKDTPKALYVITACESKAGCATARILEVAPPISASASDLPDLQQGEGSRDTSPSREIESLPFTDLLLAFHMQKVSQRNTRKPKRVLRKRDNA